MKNTLTELRNSIHKKKQKTNIKRNMVFNNKERIVSQGETLSQNSINI